jgi:hypothetical protein
MVIDRSYHPFLVGSIVESIEEQTGTRIHIPPLNISAAASDKNLNEILIVGPRDGIKTAESLLLVQYENLVYSCYFL